MGKKFSATEIVNGKVQCALRRVMDGRSIHLVAEDNLRLFELQKDLEGWKAFKLLFIEELKRYARKNGLKIRTELPIYGRREISDCRQFVRFTSDHRSEPIYIH